MYRSDVPVPYSLQEGKNNEWFVTTTKENL